MRFVIGLAAALVIGAGAFSVAPATAASKGGSAAQTGSNATDGAGGGQAAPTKKAGKRR